MADCRGPPHALPLPELLWSVMPAQADCCSTLPGQHWDVLSPAHILLSSRFDTQFSGTLHPLHPPRC